MGDINILNMESDLLVYGCMQEDTERLVNLLLQDKYQHEMQVIILDPCYKVPDCPDAPNLILPPIRERYELETTLEWLQTIIQRRLDLLASRREKYVDSFNEHFPEEKLPYITVVATEAQDLEISRNDLLQRILLNDDNAGVYLLALTEFFVEELDLGANNLMFNAMPFQDVINLIVGGSA